MYIYKLLNDKTNVLTSTYKFMLMFILTYVMIYVNARV